jgi:hypothetical protein
MNSKLIALMLMFGVITSHAQQVANFSLPNVITGKEVSLETYPSCSGLVIVFTSNSCAYDEYYRERLNSISKNYQDKVPLLLVNSSLDPAESTENMIKKAQQLGLSVPYLADKDQVLMQRLGATKTPQTFLLKNNGGEFSLVYSGAIDDNPQVQGDVRRAYLRDAIDIMLTNQKIETPEVRPVGCTIRRK